MTPTSVMGGGGSSRSRRCSRRPRLPLAAARALVDLVGGARLVCHGDKTQGLKIGSWVAIEAVGNIYYFSHLGALDRAKLFWRRAGRAGERMSAIAQSLAKRAWKGRPRGES
jgi:hypothetical protein